MMGGAGSAAGFWSLIAVILAIAAVVVVARLGLSRRERRSAAERRPEVETPQEILRRRYAAGEIDEDEYLRRLAGLSQR